MSEIHTVIACWPTRDGGARVAVMIDKVRREYPIDHAVDEGRSVRIINGRAVPQYPTGGR